MYRNNIFIPNLSCGPCLHCNEVSEGEPHELLKCDTCKRPAHFHCLKSRIPNNRLLGDNFFHFTCIHCSPDNNEQILRVKMTNLQFMLLVYYNLIINGEADASDGFLHYKTHIYTFVMNNFYDLFAYDGHKCYRDRKRFHWGAMSSIMCNTPFLFESKKDAEGRSGRGVYRLVEMSSPTILFHKYMQDRMKKRPQEDVSSLPESKFLKTSELGSRSSSCSSLSVSCSGGGKNEDWAGVSPPESPDESSMGSWFLEKDALKPFSSLPSNIFEEDKIECADLDIEDQKESENLKSSIVEQSLHPEPPECGDMDDSSALKHVSLFTQSKQKNLDENIIQEDCRDGEDENLVPITHYEERKLLKALDALQNPDSEICLLRRKLKVRRTQREHNLAVFDLTAEVRFLETRRRLMTNKEREAASSLASSGFSGNVADTTRVLDRYQVKGVNRVFLRSEQTSFKAKLVGSSSGSLDFIHSPYSLRRIKPIIFRDFSTIPHKVRLLQEVVSRFREKGDGVGGILQVPSYSPRPIDYCYVAPKHIPSMNQLAQEFFWPGIELSEVLQYPEFSCVVLYGQLVVGFGVVVPDTNLNEAYVSFLLVHPEWRRAGIAKFILYHLIQTCPGKDITLHVSATNPALIMYQQFGFKVEEFLSDFYDKYLPEDSQQCKHAMFLRLAR